MSADEALRHDVMASWHDPDDRLPPHYPDPPAELGRVVFRDGPGGDMPNLWASHILKIYFNAERTGQKPPKFSDALKDTAAHFMIGGGQ